MSYDQYSWLITIKNGASHPMVHRDLCYNHEIRIHIMDGMAINHIVSIDHGSYGGVPDMNGILMVNKYQWYINGI